MGIGNLIMLGVMIFISLTLFSTIVGVLEDMEEKCLEPNTTQTACSLFEKGSLFGMLLKNKILLFIILITISIFVIMGRTIKSLMRGIVGGFGDFFEARGTISYDDNVKEYDEKEKYLKEAETKLKEELTRKSFNDIKLKSRENKRDRGIDWGDGMDHYERR